MCPHRGSLNARPLYGAADQTGDRAAGRQRSKGRADSQKYMVVINVRTGMLPIMQDSITGILRQGKPGLRAPLAGDPQARVGPIDVRQTQIPNVVGAQGQSGEEKHDGPVT